MKPPRFTYVAPKSLDEALAIRAEHGADCALLAGGQSLLPLMSARRVSPAIVIDLGWHHRAGRDSLVRRWRDHRRHDAPARRRTLGARWGATAPHPAGAAARRTRGGPQPWHPGRDAGSCRSGVRADRRVAGPRGAAGGAQHQRRAGDRRSTTSWSVPGRRPWRPTSCSRRSASLIPPPGPAQHSWRSPAAVSPTRSPGPAPLLATNA